MEHGEHDAEQVDQDPDGVEHIVPVRSLQHSTGDRIRSHACTYNEHADTRVANCTKVLTY